MTFSVNMDAAGSILISGVSGGIPPYTYKIADKPYQTSEVFSGPNPDGSYVVSVLNGSGCETSNLVTLSRNNICLNTSIPQVQQLIGGGTRKWSRIEFKVNGVPQTDSCYLRQTLHFNANGTEVFVYNRIYNNVCTTYTENRPYCANASQLVLGNGVGGTFTADYAFINSKLVITSTEVKVGSTIYYVETFNPL